MKLISMTDFVLEQNKLLKNAPDAYDQYCKMVNYANFLKQPLKLEMFVPVDEDGNVLEEPDYLDERFELKRMIYEEAKEKVLFEDFEIKTNREGEKVIVGDYTCLKIKDLGNFTIEDLVKYVHIKLTESAIKKFKNL